MFNSKHIEELTKKLYSSLPTSLQTFENEIQQQFKEILQAAFARMDIITREEFNVQVKVLAKTREKIDALQTQVDALMK